MENIMNQTIIMRQAIKQHKPFKPHQQGELDGLCGLYALMNSVKYLRNISGWKQQTKLMTKILKHMKAKGMTSLVVRFTEGTRLDEIASVLKYIICPQYDIKRAKPYHHNPETTLKHFLRHCQGFLEQKSDKSKGIILVGLGGRYDHWTLIYRITETRIMLQDSSKRKYLNKSNCCLPDDDIQKTHILYPTHTYFLWVE